MTDRRIPDDEHAWLLARERGEQGPPVADRRARRYAQIGHLIARLPASPAGTTDRAGWEHDVLAAIDAEERRAGVARRRRRAAAAAGFAIAAVVAIVLVGRRDVPAVAPERPSGSAEREVSPGRATRGTPRAPGSLVVRYTLEGRAATGGPARELHDGDTVTTGDRMRASVSTSQDATLYLAFCSQHRLRVYPSRKGLRTWAEDSALVPGEGDLVFDGGAGAEALYLIVSRDDLAMADPQLAELIAAADAADVACASLEARLTRSPPAVAAATGVLRGALDTTGPQPVMTADSAGIVAVRYRFVHVGAADERARP